MSYPDNWVVLKIHVKKEEKPHYRLLRGWSGGYATGSSWHMNSGIKSVTRTEGGFVFEGASGSSYTVQDSKQSYQVRRNCVEPLNYYEGRYPGCISVVPYQDWTTFDWG